MTNPVIYAAAYLLLLGQPVQAPVPAPITTTIECQLPTPPHHADDPHRGHPGLAIIRGIVRHHHHHHHRGRHH